MGKKVILKIRLILVLASGIIWSCDMWSQMPSHEVRNEAEIRALMLSYRHGNEPLLDPPSQIKSDYRPAFFCRQEKALEESLRFPIRFRLGEWNYTQQLEGKGIQNWHIKSK